MRRRRTPYLFETGFIVTTIALVIAPFVLIPSVQMSLQATWYGLVGVSGARVIDIGGTSNVDLALGPDGRVWALGKYRLARFHRDSTGFDRLFDRSHRRHSRRLRVSSFASLHVDGPDSAWVGTWFGELLRYQGGRWTVSLARKEPLDQRIRAICPMGAELLLATSRGVWRFDPRTQRARLVEALPRATARWCHAGAALRVAVGAEVWRLRGTAWHREFRGSNRIEAALIKADSVAAVVGRRGYLQARDGNARHEAPDLPMQGAVRSAHGTWIATLRDGLLLRLAPGDWRKLDRNRGLAHNHVSDLLIDGNDRLWLSHYGAGITVVPANSARAAMTRLGL